MNRLLLLFFILSVQFTLAQPRYPVPTPPDAITFAADVPHTAQRLGTPGAEVRILVYGQSISMQDWWKTVRSFLEKRYPNVRLVMENRAIGGFSTDRLKHLVDNDVVSFYPDLILLHDYGNQTDYEQIIRTIRSRTTAEIAVQTDHVGVGQNDAWHDKHGNEWMPSICKKYGLARIDVRSAWKAYLAQNNLPAKDLLSDNVHLNEHGNYLMAEIINRYMETIPTTTHTRREPSGNVQTILVRAKKGQKTLNIPFTGNRVDLLTGSEWGESVSVKVDGQPPSGLLDSYFHTRPGLDWPTRQPEGFFLTNIGQLLAMKLSGQPQPEDWTLTVAAVDTVAQQLAFRLHGSRTGDDGEGRSEARFRSRSGRIVIDSTGWFRRRSPNDFKQFSWLKPGDTLRWRVAMMGRDAVSAADGPVVTVVQGLVNGQHVLQLSGKDLRSVRAIRVYRPPLLLVESR